MNILTFDIEEWYLEKILHGGREFRYHQFDEAFAKVLNDLDAYGIKATFFCVGKLAVEFPQIIKEIAARGHEVGCHSNEHTWLNKMTQKQLMNDTKDALKALEDVSGQKVVSYRAPAFSITAENKWAVNILSECGIMNDASIFPTTRDFGGYKSFPQDTPCVISYMGATLNELPICLTSIVGKNIAYSGGGYFRMLPFWLISKSMKNREYNICYFHLNDLIEQRISFMSKTDFEDYFKIPGTIKNRLIRYMKSNIGNGGAYDKFEKLLKNNSFTSVRDCEIDWSKVNKVEL